MSERLKIDSIAHGGEGVGTLASGKRAFVPLAVPGDLVEFEATERRPHFERGRLRRVLEAGAERVAPPCPQAGHCGGCQLQQLSAEGQLRAKEKNFYDALARLGGLPREAIPDARLILPSPEAFRYRIRCRLTVASGELGYLRRGSNELVPIQSCHLLAPELEAFALRLRAELRARPIRHLSAVELCVGAEGSGALALVPEARAPATWGRGAESLLDLPGLRGLVVLSPKRGKAPRILGDPVVAREAPLAPGTQLLLRPDAFAQANAEANEALVRAAVEALEPREGEELLELFSGAGNFSFALASRGARVSAVEVEGAALELARRAKAPAMQIEFIPEDVRRAIQRFLEAGRRFDGILLDPPRTGAKQIASHIARLGARRIVYVSCDPATLARDLRTLVGEGYRLVSAQPIDMFPQTYHVEAVVLLERD